MAGCVYRGTNTEPKPANRPLLPPPECGTLAGYARHRRSKEPIDDACRKANADACRARKLRKKVA